MRAVFVPVARESAHTSNKTNENIARSISRAYTHIPANTHILRKTRAKPEASRPVDLRSVVRLTLPVGFDLKTEDPFRKFCIAIYVRVYIVHTHTHTQPNTYKCMYACMERSNYDRKRSNWGSSNNHAGEVSVVL